MFPAEEQGVARLRLAEALQAVVSQRLLPRADGKGRAAALEILICTGTARDKIRDPELTGELHDYIKESREQYGMQTFDQHLMDLVSDGTVTYDTALAASSNPADFELQMRTLRRRTMSQAAPVEGPPEEPAETEAPAADRPAGFSDDLSDMLPSP
jgi:twitching motility protein PilT